MTRHFLLVFCFFSGPLWAQEDSEPLSREDSLDQMVLDEMVVTGQFEPQSIDQAVHTVKMIDRQRIEAQGAVDLADVLSNNLNITLTPNKADGRTSISMLGLDGQYVKVLIDGMPFPSIEGNGNNVDITQINLNTIERIEIVEGPMAVSYGANAMAGVVNLITKNSPSNSISVQEETVGPEYGIDRGRHIQTLSLGKQFENGLLLQLNFQRNDFKGFRSDFGGEDHTENDGQRGYDWHPKLQYSGMASIGYQNDFINAKYSFSYFRQTLDQYSRTVFPDEHPSSGLTNPFALDNFNQTDRYFHNLNLAGKLGRVNYNVATAYTGVEMEQRTLRYRILTGVEEETISSETSFLKSWTSRGNFTDFTDNPNLDLELGYEYTHESVQSINIDGGERSLDNMAGFASLEWSPISSFTLRPGIRSFYNSQFTTPLIYSFNLKYNAPGRFDIRVSYGRSYRTPNLTELYFYFVDANHDVTGNPDLLPEDGHGLSLDIKKHFQVDQFLAYSSLKVFYNDISDQITLGVVNESPLRFSYINVDRFKSKGLSLLNQIAWDDFSINAGFSYIGRFNQFSEDESNLEEFLFTPEANFNITYTLSQPNLIFAAFYKHTGSVEQYVFDADEGDFRKGKTNAFDWLDFTTTWQVNDHLQFQGGARNILDLRDIQTTAGEAGAHSDAPQSVGLTYGRSYFLRASYSF